MTSAINLSITFAASTTGILAFALFLRDLLGKSRNQVEPARLQLVPPQPRGKIDRALRRLVDQSGVPFDTTTALIIIGGAALVGMAVPLVLFEHLLLAALGTFVGGSLSLLVFSLIRWRRCAVMRKHLPEALQIISDAVHTGQTLEDACGLVAREIKGPLGQEFRHAHSQFQLGSTPLPIMDRLSRRIPLPEFNVFATAVVVHRRSGGNLGLLTERMSRAARERQELRGHVMAATAGSRLSAIGMVVGSIIAMAVLGWLEPDYVSAFFRHELGPTLLGVAIGLQLVGICWVWRILRTKY